MREKLIAIIEEVEGLYNNDFPSIEQLADGMIARGVTFATDNNVGSNWIPVTERLPERGQEVIVYSGGVLKPEVYAWYFLDKDYDNWARITHWMPLPDAPEE